MRVADERCEVRPGTIERPDLTVRMPALLFLALHRGEASAASAAAGGSSSEGRLRAAVAACHNAKRGTGMAGYQAHWGTHVDRMALQVV